MHNWIIRAIIIGSTAYLASGLATFFNRSYPFVGSPSRALFAFTVLLVVVFFRKELLELLDDKWNWIPLLLVVIYGSISGYFISQGPINQEPIGEFDLTWLFNMSVKPYLLFLILLVTCRSREELVRCLAVIYVFILLTSILYFANLSSFGVDTLDITGKRINADPYGILLNNNTVSYMAVVLSLLSMRLAELSKEKYEVYTTVFHWITLVIASWVCIFNQSRAALVFVLCIVLWSFLAILRKKHFSRIVAIVFTLLFMALTVGNFVDTTLIADAKIFDRFLNPKKQSDYGRWLLSLESIEYFKRSPIFGNDSIVNMTGIKGRDHNHYTITLSRYGLVGLILLGLYVVSIVRVIRLRSTPAQKFGAVFIFYYLLFAPPYPFLAAAFLITRYTTRELAGQEEDLTSTVRI